MKDDRIDAWLADGYRALTKDLAAVIDLDAGLAEAMRPGWSVDLAERLALAASLVSAPDRSARTAAAQPTPAGAERRQEAVSSIHRLIRLLPTLDASTRLSLRTNRDYRRLRDIIRLTGRIEDLQVCTGRFLEALASAGELAEHPTDVLGILQTEAAVLEQAFDLSAELACARALAHAWPGPRVLAWRLQLDLGRAQDLAQDIVRPRTGDVDITCDLTLALRRARDLDRGLARTGDLARALVHSLARVLAGGAVFAHIDARMIRSVRVPTESRSADADVVRGLRACLERVMDDFVGTDLRAVPLARTPLAGILWSDTTQWPSRWSDKIRQRSTEVQPSIYKVVPTGRRQRHLADQCG